MLESSARIEALANAWDQMNSEPPLAAPPAALPYFVRRAGFCGQLSAMFKRFVAYKQPGSLLSWISKLIVAAILSLLIGCIYWDVPTSDPQLKFNDRFGYHHCVMIIAIFPLLLMTIRDTHLDRKYAEKDISLKFYGRTVYIVSQVNLHSNWNSNGMIDVNLFSLFAAIARYSANPNHLARLSFASTLHVRTVFVQ